MGRVDTSFLESVFNMISDFWGPWSRRVCKERAQVSRVLEHFFNLPREAYSDEIWRLHYMILWFSLPWSWWHQTSAGLQVPSTTSRSSRGSRGRCATGWSTCRCSASSSSALGRRRGPSPGTWGTKLTRDQDGMEVPFLLVDLGQLVNSLSYHGVQPNRKQ